MNSIATITTLVDNCVEHPGKTKPDLLGEQGLSFHIQLEERSYLFDTGTGVTIKENSKQLGIQLEETDAVILSHGHDDHYGGLESILKAGGRPDLILHPHIYNTKYKRGKERQIKDSTFPKSDLQKWGCTLIERCDTMVLDHTLGIVGPIPMKREPDDHKMKDRLVMNEKGELIQDLMTDEQVLVGKTEKGLLLIVGCTHCGLLNTIEQVQTVTGENRIYGIVGGIHQFHLSDPEIREMAHALNHLSVHYLMLGHCSGIDTIFNLSRHFKGVLEPNYVGKNIKVSLLSW